YFRGAERLPGELANHILSAAFADGWFWYIPLHDGTMSVGAVVDTRRWREAARCNPEGTYRGLIARCPAIATRLRSATLVSPARRVLAQAPADLSAREAFVRLISGNGDWDAAQALLAREHARWADGIRAGRAGAVPGIELLRVGLIRRLTGLG